MSISAADVKKLRDITSAGMMECKKALEESNGDFDKAVELLRISGAAKAAKRGAERETSAGIVAQNAGVLVELLCETDFVAKSEDFLKLGDEIAAAVKSSGAKDSAAAAALTLGSGKTAEQAVADMAVVIGEKIELGRVANHEGDVAVYMHRRSADLPPAVGVLVSYSGSEDAARCRKRKAHCYGNCQRRRQARSCPSKDCGRPRKWILQGQLPTRAVLSY